MSRTDDDCLTCGEIADVEGECSKSKRDCGHHCNCSWIHDACCWCGATFDEEPDALEAAISREGRSA